jgi:oligopeptide/dipeptide ABC transporter ATP-binding protein
LTVELDDNASERAVVDGVSFRLASGGALGIVGESGSGKSLTLRAILGLLPPGVHAAGGSVRFGGAELTAASKRELRRLRGTAISMIFQEPSAALDPVVRVGAQIAEGPRARLGLSRSAARKRAHDLMQLVGIPDAERRMRAYPHELSGGMRQRVMIAIAMSSHPKVILCDEPTTALDVTIQDQILTLLRQLRTETQTAIVFVTHDLAVVGEICDTVVVMYAGRVVESGPVDEVFRHPRHAYTLGLLNAVPDLSAGRVPLVSISGSAPRRGQSFPGCPFEPRCRYSDDACVAAPPELVALGDGRATACIHPDRIPVPLPRQGDRR